jgi:nicotinamidase-related amidase
VRILSEVTPHEHDILVTKRRVSAFSGSDLDVLLRGPGVEKVVLYGMATTVAVLSTLRQAADLDYDVTVLEDLCLDVDSEAHRVLMEKVFPRQAAVLCAEAWLTGLGAANV